MYRREKKDLFNRTHTRAFERYIASPGDVGFWKRNKWRFLLGFPRAQEALDCNFYRLQKAFCARRPNGFSLNLCFISNFAKERVSIVLQS